MLSLQGANVKPKGMANCDPRNFPALPNQHPKAWLSLAEGEDSPLRTHPNLYRAA